MTSEESPKKRAKGSKGEKPRKKREDSDERVRRKREQREAATLPERARARIAKAANRAGQNKAHGRAVSARKRTEPRARGTPFEAYFAAAPLPADQPTLIFQHLQKTAGTAIRQIIHANLVGGSNGDVEHVVLDVRKSNDGPE